MSSPPGSSVHGISKARILERVAIPSRGDFPDPGIEPAASELQADSSSLNHQGSPYVFIYIYVCVCVCMYIHMCVYIHVYIYMCIYIYIRSDQSLSHVWLFATTWIAAPWWLSSKESSCNAGDLGSIPGSGRSLEKGMATHSSILAWEMPWIEKPGGLQSTLMHKYI